MHLFLQSTECRISNENGDIEKKNNIGRRNSIVISIPETHSRLEIREPGSSPVDGGFWDRGSGTPACSQTRRRVTNNPSPRTSPCLCVWRRKPGDVSELFFIEEMWCMYRKQWLLRIFWEMFLKCFMEMTGMWRLWTEMLLEADQIFLPTYKTYA